MILENQLAALATLVQDRMELDFEALSPRAASILMTLLNRDTLPVTRIAAIVGIAQPTATRLIDGLQGQALVRREARDGRVVMVALTARGRKAAKGLEDARREIVRGLLEPLGLREQALLAKLVDKLLYGATGSRSEARTTCRYCDHGLCRGAACPVNRRATEIEDHAAGAAGH